MLCSVTCSTQDSVGAKPSEKKKLSRSYQNSTGKVFFFKFNFKISPEVDAESYNLELKKNLKNSVNIQCFSPKHYH